MYITLTEQYNKTSIQSL